MSDQMDAWCQRAPDMTKAVEQYETRGIRREIPSTLAEHGPWAEVRAGLKQATRALGMIRAQVASEPITPDQLMKFEKKIDVVDTVVEQMVEEASMLLPVVPTKYRILVSIDVWISGIQAIQVGVAEEAERLRMTEIIAASTQAAESISKMRAERNRVSEASIAHRE